MRRNMLGGQGRPKSPSKVRSLAEEREARDMKQHVHDAIMALARREGRIRVTLEELQALKAGAGLSIEASSEGLLITYVPPGGGDRAG